MFVGTYERGKDKKGRVVLPKEFLSKLGKEVYITLKEERLEIRTKNNWEKYYGDKYNLIRNEKNEEILRQIYANSYFKEIDKYGRINFGSLISESKVLISGFGDLVEVTPVKKKD